MGQIYSRVLNIVLHNFRNCL